MRNIRKYTNDDVRAFSIDEFCEAYGIGRSFVYNEINKGRLIAKKIGTGRERTLIRRDDAERWLTDAPGISPRTVADADALARAIPDAVARRNHERQPHSSPIRRWAA